MKTSQNAKNKKHETLFEQRSSFLTTLQELPRHGWVFSDTVSLASQKALRRVTESFSDQIRQPSPALFYGSLQHTSSYFKDFTHLHDAVSRQCHESGLSVVLCENMFRGFAYLRFLQRKHGQDKKTSHQGGTEGVRNVDQKNSRKNETHGGVRKDGVARRSERESPQWTPVHEETEPKLQRSQVVFSNSSNIEYRRLIENISWKNWFTTAVGFLNLLSYRTSQIETETKNIESFCKKMLEMRFRRPSQIPADFTEEELQRRFGKTAALLWLLWRHESAQEIEKLLPPFRNFEGEIDPAQFASAHVETAAFANHYCTSTAQLCSAVCETFYFSLKKLQRLCTSECYYGIRDFSVRIDFDDKLFVEHDVTLALPIFEKSKTSDAVIEQALSSFVNKKTLGLANEVSLIDSQISRHYFLHSFENVEVIPRSLYKKPRPLSLLFEDQCNESDMREMRDILRIKDNAYVFNFELGEVIVEEKSYAESSDRSGKFDTASLCRFLYTARPLFTFKNPFVVSLVDLRSHYPDFSLSYTETVAQTDYFIAFLRKGASLWLKSPCVQRERATLNRLYWAAGFFDSGFTFQTLCY